MKAVLGKVRVALSGLHFISGIAPPTWQVIGTGNRNMEVTGHSTMPTLYLVKFL